MIRGDDYTCTLADWLDANADLPESDRAAVAALVPGQSYTSGGGGAAGWTVECVAGVVCPACGGDGDALGWSEQSGDVYLPCPCCDGSGALPEASTTCARGACSCVADAVHDHGLAMRDYQDGASWTM